MTMSQGIVSCSRDFMPLLNSRDNETSRGKSNMVKIKTQDFQPLLCDNTEDHGSVPETRERDKG